MTGKIIPLLAAASSILWAGGAVAETTETNSTPALNGTAIAIAYAAPGKSSNSSECKRDKGLFDRLGGFFGIAAVVNRFSDAILVNPVLNQNPALAEWNRTQAPTRVPGLKFMRTMWVASMVGGPVKFTGLPLEEAHDRFDLTPSQFNEVGSEIVKALQAFNIAQADIDQLVCIYGTSMNDVVSTTSAPKAVTPGQ
jgi:hemoglobin